MTNFEFRFTFLALIYSGISLKLLDVFTNVQPTSYLDEVFHIPQAINYCNGSFHEWDAKITTLPGLYILTLGILKPVGWILHLDFCTVYGLRIVNWLCSIANLMLLVGIRHKLLENEGKFPVQVLWGSLNLALFPVLYFFTFLYYTDQISTLLVLMMYKLHLDHHFNLSGFAGFVAVTCRQTNIIWVVFFAMQTGLEALDSHLLRIRKRTDSKKLIENLSFFVSSLLRKPRVHLPLLKDLLKKEIGFIITGMAFLVFVWVNQGIVVGDRSAHQPVINMPQLFYFSMFLLFFGLPYVIVMIKNFLRFISHNPVMVSSIILIFLAVVAFNTHVHPYLLADNRHFTFYLWRYYNRHWTLPYVLVSSHVFGLYCLYHLLDHKCDSFQAAFYVCFILSLVFQKLLEFRYFILPFIIIRLNMKVESTWQLLMESIMFLCINVYTINLFLTRTFYWTDSVEVQRFMW